MTAESFNGAKSMMQTEFTVGGRKFVLDKKKAEAAFAGSDQGLVERGRWKAGRFGRADGPHRPIDQLKI